MIQLIVCDMDGTLLHDDKSLPDTFPRLMEELYRRDIYFAVASGRSKVAAASLFGDWGEEMLFICDNGACLSIPHHPPVLQLLENEAVLKTLDACRSLPSAVPVLCGTQHFYSRKDMDAATEAEIERYYKNRVEIPGEGGYTPAEPILKIALCDMRFLESKTVPAIKRALGDKYEQIVSGKVWMDIMRKGISKGKTLAALQERLGVAPEQTMAFGDFDNDVTMLERAAYGYAMENAPDRVKAKAKFIAPSNQEDGVIKVICERLGLHLF